jgi:hypothetical protein
MMKIIKALIYAIYLADYAYAAYMTSAKPDETYWGYICVGIFAYLFTWTVSIVVSRSEKSPENKD